MNHHLYDHNGRILVQNLVILMTSKALQNITTLSKLNAKDGNYLITQKMFDPDLNTIRATYISRTAATCEHF